jgi:predicted TIM-barrel fold metal-dependent hydrolase
MKHGWKVLDSDIHVLEPAEVWSDYLDPEFRERAPQPPAPGTSGWMTIDGHIIPAGADTPERARALEIRYGSERMGRKLRQRQEEAGEFGGLDTGTRPETMLGAMDLEGIDVAVVFRAFDDIDARLAGGLCRAFNRWGRDFCEKDPARLKLGALVSLHDPDVAVREARYAVEQLGAMTLVLPSHLVRQRPLYDPAYEPLWQVAEELDVAVSLHGIHASHTADMLANRYPSNHVLGHAVGQPVELMLSLGSVITGGVAARHPRLRFAFLEGNCSWLPWWLWALDERWQEWGDRELFGQDELPSELFRRQCWVSCDVDEELAALVVDEVGDDNLVLSTDWPHDDSAFPHAIDEFVGLDRLSDETKRKVLWDNCARLYGIR